MPDTLDNTDTTDRLHVPTDREIEQCSRLYMTVENARKTLLEHKWQTRRIMDPQPSDDFVPSEYGTVHGRDKLGNLDPDIELGFGVYTPEGRPAYLLPEKPGDRMLVTTPHWRAHTGTEKDRIWDPATGVVRFSGSTPGGPNAICVPDEEGWHPPKAHDWHPVHASFLMPKWASRIAVEVEAVWVERLHRIVTNTRDLGAEGVEPIAGTERWEKNGTERVHSGLPGGLIRLWRSLHGEGAWERNDWVRVIEYSLVQ